MIAPCPFCQHDLKVPDSADGRKTKCSWCGAAFDIPSTPAALLSAGPPAKAKHLSLTGVGAVLLVVAVVVGTTLYLGKRAEDARLKRIQDEILWAAQARAIEAPVAPAQANESVIARGDHQLLVDAKKILLDSLKDVGGVPEANIKNGIGLLNQMLLQPVFRDDAEARLLLEHAQLAISDDAAVRFLIATDEATRQHFAQVFTSAISAFVRVKTTQLESLSPRFGSRFHTNTKQDATTWICDRSFGGGGEYCNSIETAFYSNLKKNAKGAFEQIAAQKQAERDEAEDEAVLRDGTSEFKLIIEFPERYEFGHFYLDGLFGSRFGNMKRLRKDKLYTVAFTCDRTHSRASGRLDKEEISLVVSEEMGEQLLYLKQGEFDARVYCRVRFRSPDDKTYPVGFIYRIEFFEGPSRNERPKIKITDPSILELEN